MSDGFEPGGDAGERYRIRQQIGKAARASRPWRRAASATAAAPEPTNDDRSATAEPRRVIDRQEQRLRSGVWATAPIEQLRIDLATARIVTTASVSASMVRRATSAITARLDAPTVGALVASAKAARGGDADARAGEGAGSDRHRDAVEVTEGEPRLAPSPRRSSE